MTLKEIKNIKNPVNQKEFKEIVSFFSKTYIYSVKDVLKIKNSDDYIACFIFSSNKKTIIVNARFNKNIKDKYFVEVKIENK